MRMQDHAMWKPVALSHPNQKDAAGRAVTKVQFHHHARKPARFDLARLNVSMYRSLFISNMHNNSNTFRLGH
jgi:hypothetical protein